MSHRSDPAEPSTCAGPERLGPQVYPLQDIDPGRRRFLLGAQRVLALVPTSLMALGLLPIAFLALQVDPLDSAPYLLVYACGMGGLVLLWATLGNRSRRIPPPFRPRTRAALALAGVVACVGVMQIAFFDSSGLDWSGLCGGACMLVLAGNAGYLLTGRQSHVLTDVVTVGLVVLLGLSSVHDQWASQARRDAWEQQRVRHAVDADTAGTMALGRTLGELQRRFGRARPLGRPAQGFERRVFRLAGDWQMDVIFDRAGLAARVNLVDGSSDCAPPRVRQITAAGEHAPPPSDVLASPE